LGDRSELTALLTAWLPTQRWYAGKGRSGAGVRILLDTAVAPMLRHVVVEVGYDDGGPADRYQVPLTVRPDAPFGHDGFLLGEMSGGLVYDGLHDPDGSAALLDFLGREASADGLSGHTLEPLVTLPAHAVGAEQSNTSIVYGEQYILKVFRRLWPGTNPDLELTRALADAGSPRAPRPLAWLDGRLDPPPAPPTTFALMQEFLRSGTEGWRLALASVRDLYAEGDLHAEEVGGDFAAEAERLGAATAEVHALLAERFPTQPADRPTMRATADGLHARLDAALAGVPELAPCEASARAAFEAMVDAPSSPDFQRVHGDLHLGQVLRTETGWVLFDFEGEPARPVSERIRLSSPLRDVAGMLRSFDYAAQSMLLERVGETGLGYRAREWAERNRGAFLRGYGAASPVEFDEHGVVLRAFELDKALYEVLYEARHRPAWLEIPLGSVRRLTAVHPPLPTGSATS
jgi:maltokinase